LLISPFCGAVGLMVNEYRITNGGPAPFKFSSDEFIEFVLTENATAAELASLTFGDTNHQTSQINSVFTFDQTTLQSVLTTSGRSYFVAGTILVVKGTSLGAQNLSYNPLETNLSDADAWSIELVAGQGALDHPTAVVNGNIDMDRRGEVVWVSADNPPANSLDTSGFIHAIGHDDNPGAIANAVSTQFGSNHILNQTFPTTTRLVQNTGTGGSVSLAASTSASMGAPNSVANAAWVEGALRAIAVPEPSRVFLSLLALGMTILRRRRAG
jgi:hypothetical protein